MKKPVITALCCLLFSPAAVLAEMVAIAGEDVNMRSGPGTTNPVVDRRSNGDVLIVESVENGWCKVLYRNAAGQAARGYVSADYLQLSN